MKKLILLSIISVLVLSGCVGNDLEDNQVYIIEKGIAENEGDNYVGFIDTEGMINFQEGKEEIILNKGEVLLTISPDGQSYYVMEFMNQYDQYVLKGNPLEKVKITHIDLADDERNVIVQDIPLVSQVKWNSEGDMVAFSGGNKLTIYDAQEEKLLFDYRLEEEPIKDFSWSPIEENKLYLQSTEGFSSSIYYVDSQKRVELYETNKKIYPIGRLDEQYLYAIQWRSVESKENKQEVLYTVLIDEQGQVIKLIGEGMFKESYGRSVILLGANGFGLQYINDINQVSKGKVVTKEYIYDTKFIYNGNVAYITEDNIDGNNQFLLHVVNTKGKEIGKFQVSGSSFALTADGKTGYIGGKLKEEIDFVNLTMKSNPSSIAKSTSKTEDEQIIHRLRGAIEVYAKLALGITVDEENINEYFVNTTQPTQEAKSDVLGMSAQRQDKKEEPNINIESRLSYLWVDNRRTRASAIIDIYVSGSNNMMFQHKLAWELIKQNGRWYITGLSTFPEAEIKQDVESAVKELVYNDELKYEDIHINNARIGQIQFWQKEKVSLSMNTDEANLAKINIETIENGNNKFYTLWLKRVNADSWQVARIVER